MFLEKIISSLILVGISCCCNAQSEYFATDFIPYKFPAAADSLLVSKLDSINSPALENLCLDINLADGNPVYCTVLFIYIGNKRNNEKVYLHYLAKNSNRFYVSLNNKYKVPIIFGRYETAFKYDYERFPLAITDGSGEYLMTFDILYDLKIDMRDKYPLPERLWREELKQK